MTLQRAFPRFQAWAIPLSRRYVPGPLHSFRHKGNYRGLPLPVGGVGVAGSDVVFHAPSHHVALE